MESNSIKEAVRSFIILVGIGWDVETALKCAYDRVYDEIDSDSFIDLCQNECKNNLSKSQAKLN